MKYPVMGKIRITQKRKRKKIIKTDTQDSGLLKSPGIGFKLTIMNKFRNRNKM